VNCEREGGHKPYRKLSYDRERGDSGRGTHYMGKKEIEDQAAPSQKPVGERHWEKGGGRGIRKKRRKNPRIQSEKKF